jgi:hypothetical protein
VYVFIILPFRILCTGADAGVGTGILLLTSIYTDTNVAAGVGTGTGISLPIILSSEFYVPVLMPVLVPAPYC